MILCMTPWDNEANLGRAYNDCMMLLPLDAWAIFKDHDSMPTTGQWHRQFAEAIAFQPEAGAIVATTNRIASAWQRRGDSQTNDIAWHRRYGAERLGVRTLLDISGTKGFGGVMFAVSARAWLECGGFVEGALGCTDHSLHFRLQKIGRKVWLHEGIYCFHWRHHGEPDPTSAHPKVPDCPCRGREEIPTERIQLP